jgi:hypothetical protein
MSSERLASSAISSAIEIGKSAKAGERTKTPANWFHTACFLPKSRMLSANSASKAAGLQTSRRTTSLGSEYNRAGVAGRLPSAGRTESTWVADW